MTAARSNVEMGVGDVANERGCHRHTARTWLRELEAKHGAKAVYRRKGRLYTTRAAMVEYAPASQAPPSKMPALRLANAVVDHDQRIGELERRLNVVTRELSEFRRQAQSWFAGRPVKR